MDTSNEKMIQLIIRYIKGTLTVKETEELNKWLKNPNNKILFDKITKKQNIINKSIRYDSYNVDQAWGNLNSKLPHQTYNRRRWLAYAAAILLPLIVVSAILLMKQIDVEPQIAEHQILPGGNSAMIYFSDGEVVDLDNDTTSVIIKQNLQIKKTDGKLIISSRKPETEIVEKIKLNKIKTGKGDEMQIILSDGTHVWLNADSYLEFPSRFTNDERRVKANGEAFFEVARNEAKPFFVELGQMSLKVLGTQFNVRYYPEEKNIVSTLIEGSVEISNFMGDNVKLIPGQSASLHRQTDTIQVKNVDVKSVIAWKEGRFCFENKRLEDIMNDLSRWYDFEFSFEDEDIKNERFSVDVLKFENCNKILSKIAGTKVVAFEIKKEKVIIKNNQ